MGPLRVAEARNQTMRPPKGPHLFEPERGIEPLTCSLRVSRSTPELLRPAEEVYRGESHSTPALVEATPVSWLRLGRSDASLQTPPCVDASLGSGVSFPRGKVVSPVRRERKGRTVTHRSPRLVRCVLGTWLPVTQWRVWAPSTVLS
jgi:hypothetical protein